MKKPRYGLLGLIGAFSTFSVFGALIAYDKNNTIVSQELREREYAISLPTVSNLDFHHNGQVEIRFHLGTLSSQREVDFLKIAERLLERRGKVVFYAPQMPSPNIIELNKERIERLK